MPPFAGASLQQVGLVYADTTVGKAAFITGLYTVFVAFGGAIILHESLGSRGIVGCDLMFAGMLLSQLWTERKGGTASAAGSERA